LVDDDWLNTSSYDIGFEAALGKNQQ